MKPTILIRIDDDLHDHLEQIAVPFEDTPNRVLRRLILGEDARTVRRRTIDDILAKSSATVRNIILVLWHVRNGMTRARAVSQVSRDTHIFEQTVTDKITRKIDMSAADIDHWLSPDKQPEFRELLVARFPKEAVQINHAFSLIPSETILGLETP